MRSTRDFRSIIFLLALIAVPAAFGGFTYMFIRAWAFILDMEMWRTLLLIAMFGIVPALIASTILIALAEIGRWARFLIWRRRVDGARCWRCRYPRQDVQPASCPECGTNPSRLSEYRYPSVREVASVVLLGVAAVVLVGLLVDLYISTEDLRFIEEVRRQGGQSAHYRDRAWPNQGFGLVYNPPYGFHVND